LNIVLGGLDDPRIIALLEAHLAAARATSPPESVHALDLDGLKSPELSFWSVRDGEAVLGVGALKALSADHGEVKSMYTHETARGRGVGGTMLRHIIETATIRGHVRLSLETGSQDYFAPARSLYARHGFEVCPPFGDYVLDPNSVFMTLDLYPRK
jgi:putative acetyltransferase